MHCLILADFWVFLSLRLRSLVWVVFLIVNSSLAIDMSKFKKCEDSSFCKFVYETFCINSTVSHILYTGWMMLTLKADFQSSHEAPRSSLRVLTSN
jgi:hypothetical protein